MVLPVTILYGSLSILITVLLGINVSLHRMEHRVSVTDAVAPELLRKVRAHGNSVEWLAVTLLLLGFLELQHVQSLTLHILGGIIVIARLLHSIFMLSKSRLTKFSATATYAVSLVMVFWSLYLRLR